MKENCFFTDRLILREINDDEWDNYYKHVTEKEGKYD